MISASSSTDRGAFLRSSFPNQQSLKKVTELPYRNRASTSLTIELIMVFKRKKLGLCSSSSRRVLSARKSIIQTSRSIWKEPKAWKLSK